MMENENEIENKGEARDPEEEKYIKFLIDSGVISGGEEAVRRYWKHTMHLLKDLKVFSKD